MGIPAYTPTQWTNGSGEPMNDDNFNKVEQAIKTVTDEAIDLKDNPVKSGNGIFGVAKIWLTNGNTVLNISTN